MMRGRCSSKREVFVFVLCFVKGFLMHEMDGAPGWLVGCEVDAWHKGGLFAGGYS